MLYKNISNCIEQRRFGLDTDLLFSKVNTSQTSRILASLVLDIIVRF